jgi:two-component system, chemotaxis family, chemotaxis protein CheY
MKTLIVEDDFTSRILLQEILKPYGQAHIAVNGQDAVAAARIARQAGTPFDLICLDIMMPKMDGQEALRQIRAMEEEMGVAPKDRSRVIMVSALGDMKNVLAAYRNLCDGYVAKPLDKAKLLEELAKLNLLPG